MKLVISDPKTGKTYQTEIPKEQEGSVIGAKIGAEIEVGVAPGYKLKITGGSDKDGIPMRHDVSGGRKTYVIISSGPGVRVKEKGERRRKAVRGNIVTSEIAQLNTIVVSPGEKKLEELFPPKEKKEEKK